MELDDFKNVIVKEAKKLRKDNDSSKSLTERVEEFDRDIKRKFFLETLFAALAFLIVVIMIIKGSTLYPLIIGELLPEIAKSSQPELNFAMYFAMILMAAYCLFVPAKLYLSRKVDSSLGWTLSARVDNEIEKLKKQRSLWSNAHIWSLTPALVIGVMFFWGLQYSLAGSWLPSLYLSLYFAFLVLTTFGGLWLKKDMIENKIHPLLSSLELMKNEIQDEKASA